MWEEEEAGAGGGVSFLARVEVPPSLCTKHYYVSNILLVFRIKVAVMRKPYYTGKGLVVRGEGLSLLECLTTLWVIVGEDMSRCQVHL